MWILSVLCSTEVTSGFVYDRARRSGEDGTSARIDCEYCVHSIMMQDFTKSTCPGHP